MWRGTNSLDGVTRERGCSQALTVWRDFQMTIPMIEVNDSTISKQNRAKHGEGAHIHNGCSFDFLGNIRINFS